ncbi:MAG: acyl-CoA thioesterase [Myxococcales bacterium]|nr:acyl-CoA thioesterase [Myxococcales bacterium]
MSERTPPPGRDHYAHFSPVQTRWMDNDVYGHVNNVVYYAYFDTIINAWLVAEGGLDVHGGEVIGLCVESGCKYVRPAAYPDALEAGLTVTKLGRSSVRYEIGIFGADGEPSAFGHFVHVFVDRASRRPADIPARLRGALERLQHRA